MTARRLLVASFLFSVVSVRPAAAAPIVLCNTGQPNAVTGCSLLGVTTMPDGSVDPNYLVTSVPAPEIGAPVVLVGAARVVAEDGFPIPPWVANDGNSKWIGPTPSTLNSDGPNGFYSYTTTFSLTGLDPTTARISGSWAVDDFGEIYLNGTGTGETITCTACFSALTPFLIESGFVSGLNTLEFRVENFFGGPTGLRVDDIIGTADLIGEPIPEPASMLLLGTGLVGAAMRRRRAARA